VTADWLQTLANNEECAGAHNHQGTESLGFLRPAGSRFVQIDTVFQQAVSRFKIEERFLSVKLGISGIRDLYKTTVDRHDNMLLLDPESSGESLRKAIADFFFTFQGTKSCSEYTAAAATLIHITQSSEGLNLQVRQALIAGIGLSAKEKTKMAETTANTGRLPARQLLYGHLEALQNEEWTGLIHIAVALLCFDDNRGLSFEKARNDLNEAKLSNFNKPSEALAHIFKLHQSATTAFGRSFITYYDLFNLIKDKLPSKIKHEIDEMLQPDQINCDWKDIEDTVITAWTNSSRRPCGYYDCMIKDVHHPTDNKELTMHAALHPPAHDSLRDITLKCQRLNEDGSTCGEAFIFNTAEQLRYKQLGFTNLPKSCMKHRGQKPRHYAADPCGGNCDVDKCREFQIGVCKYGNKCKFSHAEDKPTNFNIAEEQDEEDLAIAWHMAVVDNDSDDSEGSW